MGYYDYRAFGSPLDACPTPSIATLTPWRPISSGSRPGPSPSTGTPRIRRFYYENELSEYQRVHKGFLYRTLLKAINGSLFFIGFALLPPIIMFRRVLLDRRTRFLVWCVAVMAAGMLIQIFFIAHYVAPFTAAFYALGLQAMRHLRVAKFAGGRWGSPSCGSPLPSALPSPECEYLPVRCISALPSGRRRNGAPTGTGRPCMEKSGRESSRNWSSCRANSSPSSAIPAITTLWMSGSTTARTLTRSKVIWAREMDTADDLKLIRHYSDRQRLAGTTRRAAGGDFSLSHDGGPGINVEEQVSACRPYGTRINFPTVPSTPPSAACWARLCRPYGLGFSAVIFCSQNRRQFPLWRSGLYAGAGESAQTLPSIELALCQGTASSRAVPGPNESGFSPCARSVSSLGGLGWFFDSTQGLRPGLRLLGQPGYVCRAIP